jgi:hypothetical protein
MFVKRKLNSLQNIAAMMWKKRTTIAVVAALAISSGYSANLPMPHFQQIMYPNSLVIIQMINILGVNPTRKDLLYFVKHLNWGPLTRDQQRFKSQLVAVLESKKSIILPFLYTKEGTEALIRVYRESKEALPRQGIQSTSSIDTFEDLCSISFFLNNH